MENILSVKELNFKLKQMLEAKFPYVWIKGEVTNCARPTSGHLYFSLKENDELLNCVWFKHNQNSQAFDPITGEVYEDGPKPSIAKSLREGQEVICTGKLGVYSPRGQYQLVVDFAQETGLGQLYLAFEKLKQKLSSEGLFDYTKKKVIPAKISHIALITAPSGAVIKDFLRISQSRGQKSFIFLYPSLVQGNEASKSLLQALIEAEKGIDFNGKFVKPDIIVMIRGGGSIEDLWCFNSEELARAISKCKIPVLTGIGHEPDRTIADYVADFSAATPSHLAQIIFQDRGILYQQLDDTEKKLTELSYGMIFDYGQKLKFMAKNLSLVSPQNRLNNQTEQVNGLYKQLKSNFYANLNLLKLQVENFSQKLSKFSPNLDTYLEKTNTEYVFLIKGIEKQILQKEQMLGMYQEKLPDFVKKIYKNKEQEFNNLEIRLKSHNPLTPMEKGYILAEKQMPNGQKQIIRSVKELNINDTLELNFNDGKVESKVEKIINETVN